MNPERLKKLQAQVAQVRIGGKGKLWHPIAFCLLRLNFRPISILDQLFLFLGTPRRKKKFLGHATAATDDKKLQSTLKKLAVNPIQGIEEVNMMNLDGTVLHFNNPRVSASLNSNTFAITGHAETKSVSVIKSRGIRWRRKVMLMTHNFVLFCRSHKCCREFWTISGRKECTSWRKSQWTTAWHPTES